jgi:hypothetical protein
MPSNENDPAALAAGAKCSGLSESGSRQAMDRMKLPSWASGPEGALGLFRQDGAAVLQELQSGEVVEPHRRTQLSSHSR